MYKQIIIARKDLGMSPGKLAAQVSHASMAFLTDMVRHNSHRFLAHAFFTEDPDGGPAHYSEPSLQKLADQARAENEGVFYAKENEEGIYVPCEPEMMYRCNMFIPQRLYEDWINGSFTKCVLEAKSKEKLLKAKEMAEALGMEEGKDFFLIRDNCCTELQPEEVDGDGTGHTLTCIGFVPMEAERIDQIGRKFQLWRDA